MALVLLPTGPEPNPDVDLIRLCEDRIANRVAFNADSRDTDVNPFWHAYHRIDEQIRKIEVTTLAGVIAKARVAQDEAKGHGWKGSEEWDSPAMNLARDVVKDLLRLCGEG